MKKIIGKILKKIRGNDYELDDRIPLSYYIYIIRKKVFDLIRGLTFKNKKGTLFRGKKVELICRKKISFGRYVNINDYALIDALSEDGVVFGDFVSLGEKSTIRCSGSLQNLGKGLFVGNNVGLGTHCFYGCAGGISIGDDTIIGNYVTFHSENHNYESNDIAIRLQGVNRKGIKIGKNCWLGAKVTILDGVEIGDGCIIAAGSVVINGVYEQNSILAGVPAKQIKKRF